ncbi:TetR/AcrR family transcriptional regulator [Chitinophaga silvatica]|uniref:TetR/AcrR family transcriptional regulator n=1 Tax=Chitinophaga silvatica TaxID=2282649 RepID=A0A3E1YGC1_9BACT|nr:TetR/AcrR family transcriptional regulator [Chitinophaga silvatica]RFS26412.1 TetR/AcrR family transcriptional regulator [Chitinophaga silvatica]
MGIVERKEREKAEMRRRIADVAIKMFVEEGYEKVSIRNIADKIEYSPATIYLYFKDKDRLLYEVQTEAFHKLTDHFRDKITDKDPFKRLEQLAMAYIGFAWENPELYDLMFIIKAPMNAIPEEERWEGGDGSYLALLDLVNECVEKKVIKYTDPNLAAMSMWAFAHGLISLQLRGRCLKATSYTVEDLPQVIEKAAREFLNNMKA